MRNPIVLVCSVELELSPLTRRLQNLRPFACGGRQAWLGDVDGTPCVAFAAGMGKTNAAHGLTVLLERVETSAIIGFGVGGAYRRSGLEIGDVAIATGEVYGDEGVATPDGWISSEGIGIPLIGGDDPRYNDFPVDEQLTTLLATAGPVSGRIAQGTFVTLSCCSGTAAAGDEIAERFGGICESMEGAAYAHIAALYSLPFAEVRGISNLVVERDLTTWRLRDAAEAAAERVVAGLRSAPSLPLSRGQHFAGAPPSEFIP